MVDGVLVAGGDSIERRVLKGELFAALTMHYVADMLDSNAEDEDREDNDGDATNSSIKPSRRPPCSALSDTSELSLPSCEGAVVCNANVSPCTVRQRYRDGVDCSANSNAEGPPENRRKMSGGFRRVFCKGKMDWSTLLSSGSVAFRPQTRTRCADSDISNCLRFLIREKNAQLLSWGLIRVRFIGGFVIFLGMLRRTSSEQLWWRSKAEYRSCSGSGDRLLGRTVFIRIFNTFTRPEHKQKPVLTTCWVGWYTKISGKFSGLSKRRRK